MKKGFIILSILIVFTSVAIAEVDLMFKKTEINVLSPEPAREFKAQILCKGGTADNFNAIIKLDGKLIYSQHFDHMDNGQLFFIGITKRNPSLGLHRVEFIIDNGNSVSELNEDNNTEILTFKITDQYNCEKYAKESADLCIRNVVLRKLGSDYRISFGVQNDGLKCVKEFRIQVKDSFNDIVYNKVMGPGISRVGEEGYALIGKISKSYRISLSKSDFDKFINCDDGKIPTDENKDSGDLHQQCSQVKVMVDPLNSIKESNEGNNDSDDIILLW